MFKLDVELMFFSVLALPLNNRIHFISPSIHIFSEDGIEPNARINGKKSVIKNVQ